MTHSLSTYKSSTPPRTEPPKPMGRPRSFNDQFLENLRTYVETHLIASLPDIQNHFITTHNTKYSKSNFSRRLQGMGYQHSMIGRGHTSTEKRNLPDISPEDWERLLRDPAAKEAMTAGWGTVYAWPKSSAPVRRRVTEGQISKRNPRISGDGIEGEGMETLHLVMVLIMGMRQLHKPHLHSPRLHTPHLHNLHLEGLWFTSSYLASNRYLHLC